MVTFSPEIPYSEALKKGNEQQKVMDLFLQDESALQNIESDTFLEKIMHHYTHHSIS